MYIMCTKLKTLCVPHLDQRVLKAIEKGDMSAKNHPGKINLGISSLPADLVETIKKVLKDTCSKSLKNDTDLLSKHLLCRQLPASNMELKNASEAYITAVKRTEKAYVNADKVTENAMPTVQLTDNRTNENALQRFLKRRLNAWYPINYTTYVGKQYLVGRMAAEYAVLDKIFAEITSAFPTYQPHSLFDFGSGVATVSWAARKYWQNSLQEYFCVDSSSDMNELAKLIMKGGDDSASLPITGLYFRQFLPATTSLKYSLVVSSYSLFELPSAEDRLQTISKLWNKTEDFLIIVEQGTRHGFQIINEVRDFMLQSDRESKDSTGVYVFSPCPHEFDCPVSKSHEKSCSFIVPFVSPAICGKSAIKKEVYSYVVLKKGKRTTNHWPRVVAWPVKRRKHTHCRLCTNEGKLREIVFTKHKHGLTLYHCGRSAKLGDRLPIDITVTDADF